MKPMIPVRGGPRRQQRGVTLIEVLVTIVVLSLGLLGMAGLQLSSMRLSQGSQMRSTAAQLATDMAERMRSGDARNYALALTATRPGGTSQRERDQADWLARVAALPGGQGGIAIDAVNNTVTITVQWDDSRAAGVANATASHVLETRVWGF